MYIRKLLNIVSVIMYDFDIGIRLDDIESTMMNKTMTRSKLDKNTSCFS